ncbi:MAG TPA: type II and III secretion system protein family protein [Caulobacteraceae bacterium]|jgi:pilus assembly protein CpaC
MRLSSVLALAVALLPAAAPAWSQSATEPSSAMRVDLSAQGSQSRTITIPKGKSAMVELPVDARDVLVTNPAVADALLRSPRHISVLGVAPGQTDAVFFDAAGRRILALSIRVDQDFSAVGQTINRILPGSNVHVEGVNNSVVLSGQVANLTDADKAVQIAQQFTAKPEQVLNMLSIAGKEQVMLKVRIIEMQRSSLKQLGVNLAALSNDLNGSPIRNGITALKLTDTATFGVNGAALGGLSNSGAVFSNGNGTQSAGASIDAFERVGLIRTLAEPNLTTVSGEAAKFLAGGEFPVPTGEDNTGKISIEFKPFGVGLGFTPVVLSGGRISLKISTEVSELTNQGAFALATSGTTSLTIPGLDVRRAETTVELPSGGAMMIAGLLKEQSKQDLDSLPGLMNLPVLGALFRSRDYQEGETELVVIVTPYLVQPTSPDKLQTPADGLRIASDAETLLLGHMNKIYKAPPAADAAARNYQGPVGYVIE